MAPNTSHALVLGVAIGALVGCKSSALHADGATDGSTNDGPRCTGAPVDCLQGGPLGDGVACGDFGSFGSCVGDQWTCPEGMVDERVCTCGGPGVGCAGATCTPDGWTCPDAGADGGPDATDADGSSCAGEAPIDCARTFEVNTTPGTIIICDDVAIPPTCVDGHWACTGGIDFHLCTCTSPIPPGCGCTTIGLSCSDGGTDGPNDAGRGADASSCAGQVPIACVVDTGPILPGANSVCSDQGIPPTCVDGHWTCQGGVDTRLCTCFGAVPPGCTCTKQGWSCPDGGTDGPNDADRNASCDVGCAPSSAGSYCGANEQQWECQGSYDPQAFAACRDPATNLQRYCCATTFQPTCHAG